MEPRTVWLWGSSAIHWATVSPNITTCIRESRLLTPVFFCVCGRGLFMHEMHQTSWSKLFLRSRSRKKESPSPLGTTRRARSIMASWCTTRTDSSRPIIVSAVKKTWVCATVRYFKMCLFISSYYSYFGARYWKINRIQIIDILRYELQYLALYTCYTEHYGGELNGKIN